MSCLDNNSYPSNYRGCDCKIGYYKESIGKCEKCNYDCYNCSNIFHVLPRLKNE